MRKVIGAVAATLALSTASAAPGKPAAGAHNFLSLDASDPVAVHYWDAGAVVRQADGSLEVSVLAVSRFPMEGDQQTGRFHTQVERYRMSCEWRTSRRIDFSGPLPPAGWRRDFLDGEIKAHIPAQDSIEDLVMNAACADRTATGFATMEAVLADADRSLPAEPPPLEIRPVDQPSGPKGVFEDQLQVRRLGEIDRSPDGASVRYLDWATAGGEAAAAGGDAMLVTAVLTITKPTSYAEGVSVELKIMDIDCANRATSDSYRGLWTAEGYPVRARQAPPAWAAAGAGTPAAKVLEAACKGREPAVTLSSVRAAVDAARAGWGLPPITTDAVRPTP